MILAVSVFIGVIAGVLRARANHTVFEIPDLRYYGLAVLGFVPQYLFFFTSIGQDSPDWIVRSGLVISQIVFVLFVLANRSEPGFWVLGTGLSFNLLVILVNGGFMPISPEVVYRLLPNVPPYLFRVGDRFGSGKDLILPIDETRLHFLSDRFLLPDWSPYQVAFSIGDVLLVIGMLVFFWKLGGNLVKEKELA